MEDALLPRRPEEDITELTGSRALAIRLVDHPAPTNCTKYIVLRPNTAPSPAPSTKPPLLPKRPKTAKIIRKVPEIEFALKWDLKENDIMEEEHEDDAIEVVDTKKKAREPPSPRSVSSVDSGIHMPKAKPKTAWGDGPDTRELASKLERLEVNGADEVETRSPPKKPSEPESGYGSPKSAGSLPSVGSRASSGRASVKLPLKTGSATPSGKDSSRTISMDSQRLAQHSGRSASKRGSAVASPAERHGSKSSSRSGSSRASAAASQASRRDAKGTPSPSPQPRDPLAIMETMDSVFHTVPLRDTGRGVHTYRSTPVGPRQQAATTQTEDLAREADEAGGGAAPPAEVRRGHFGVGTLEWRFGCDTLLITSSFRGQRDVMLFMMVYHPPTGAPQPPWPGEVQELSGLRGAGHGPAAQEVSGTLGLQAGLQGGQGPPRPRRKEAQVGAASLYRGALFPFPARRRAFPGFQFLGPATCPS